MVMCTRRLLVGCAVRDIVLAGRVLARSADEADRAARPGARLDRAEGRARRRLVRVGGLLLSVSLWLSACAPDLRPNIIVIVIDTLRADRVGWHRTGESVTPVRFATRGGRKEADPTALGRWGPDASRSPQIRSTPLLRRVLPHSARVGHRGQTTAKSTSEVRHTSASFSRISSEFFPCASSARASP